MGVLALALALSAPLFAEDLADEAPSAAISEAAEAVEETPLDESDREHWSFRPLKPIEPPTVEDQAWPRTQVDNFVLQKLEQEELGPSPPAGRGELLRRVKFDLLGLPPTLGELAVFEADDAPDAYERLIERLLASPAFGERWAQHWLDLARFAETDGFEHDKVRPDAWRYRQWVVDALNTDMPYDRFITLQLAGDRCGEPGDAIATAFCTAGPDMPDINEQDLRRHDKLNEIAGTIGASLLGLQTHCAQCHDHKYDPISQADFYRLRGIFESAVPQLKRDQPLELLTAEPQPFAAYVYHRGELGGRGGRVEPAPPRIATPPDAAPFDPNNPREAFARSLFEPGNPLTARVIANRIWQHHLGRSLSENPSDFGVSAGEPTHPELLDWLAIELRRGGWSMKHLHRVILLSATYRQAGHPAAGDAAAAKAFARSIEQDPENELYGRFPRKRLEGEAIRDALLAVANRLDRRYGGPSVLPPLPGELTGTLLKGQWEASPREADHARRSVYVFARRNLRYPIFEAFDRPDAGASCPRRDRSTTAIQGLLMLNGDLTFEAARGLCEQLPADAPDDELVEGLFLRTLARRPSAAEADRFVGYLHSAGDRRESLLTLALALLNGSEFIYVD